MTVVSFPFPDVVGLHNVRPLSDSLAQYIKTSPTPIVTTDALSEGGLPVLQLLVAGNRFARSLGKSLVVEGPPGGVVSRLLATHGLDAALCGVQASHGSTPEMHSGQGA